VSKNIYMSLAINSMRKNKQIYFPYLLTCVVSVMLFFIVFTLSQDPLLSTMKGGTTLSAILIFGTIIIGVFAVALIFYANTIVFKNRNKEFGLYNVLGMRKGHVGRILAWETVITGTVSIVIGISLGVVLSKFLQLVLLKILNWEPSFGLNISIQGVVLTSLIFVGLFLVVLISNIIRIAKLNAIDLIHGSNKGEIEPKSKWVLALLGVLSLGVGYGLAIYCRTAMAAVSFFFVAVIFVIIGTYLLYTAFSIVLLKKLKANKNYYYQTNHFATVSGMLFRMKRNAGELASICILSTMVLVTVSTTVCLYAGTDSMLETTYPTEGKIKIYNPEDRSFSGGIENIIISTAEDNGREVSNLDSYLNISFSATHIGNSLLYEGSGDDVTGKSIAIVDVLTLDDFNKITGENLELSENEVLFYSSTGNNKDNETKIYQLSYITKNIDSYPMKLDSAYIGFEHIGIVVNSDDEIFNIQKAISEAPIETGVSYGYPAAYFIFDYDLDGTMQEKSDCETAIITAIEDSEYGNLTVWQSCRSFVYEEFFNMYGGLFFLGVFLGIVFLLATILIMYYKQISEGYDDRENFQIMQKVGMTKQEVKSAIHSQVMIVFFLPLVTATIHIAFAFPMIRRMLSLFGLGNAGLFILVVVITVAIFALIYTLVYKLTARTYYKIVN